MPKHSDVNTDKLMPASTQVQKPTGGYASNPGHLGHGQRDFGDGTPRGSQGSKPDLGIGSAVPGKDGDAK